MLYASAARRNLTVSTVTRTPATTGRIQLKIRTGNKFRIYAKNTGMGQFHQRVHACLFNSLFNEKASPTSTPRNLLTIHDATSVAASLTMHKAKIMAELSCYLLSAPRIQSFIMHGRLTELSLLDSLALLHRIDPKLAFRAVRRYLFESTNEKLKIDGLNYNDAVAILEFFQIVVDNAITTRDPKYAEMLSVQIAEVELSDLEEENDAPSESEEIVAEIMAKKKDHASEASSSHETDSSNVSELTSDAGSVRSASSASSSNDQRKRRGKRKGVQEKRTWEAMLSTTIREKLYSVLGRDGLSPHRIGDGLSLINIAVRLLHREIIDKMDERKPIVDKGLLNLMTRIINNTLHTVCGQAGCRCCDSLQTYLECSELWQAAYKGSLNRGQRDDAQVRGLSFSIRILRYICNVATEGNMVKLTDLVGSESVILDRLDPEYLAL